MHLSRALGPWLQVTVFLFLLLSLPLAESGRRRAPCPSKRCICHKVRTRIYINCRSQSSGQAGDFPLEIPQFKQRNITYERLSLAEMGLKEVPKGSLENVWASFLNLSWNPLDGGLQKGTFNGIDKTMTGLSLTHCGLSKVPKYAFNGLSNLQQLYMQDNNMTQLEKGDFQGMPNLIQLSLYRNGITDIQSGAFDGLRSLQQLALFQNDLTKIPRNTFKGLSNLTSLDLNENNLSKINLKGLRQLTWLSLDSNQLQYLRRGTFKGLRNLKYLKIEKNPLEEISPATFRPCRRLRFLSLDISKLTTLSNRTFGSLRRLQSLFLLGEVNRTDLPSGVFHDLVSLKHMSYEDSTGEFSGLAPEHFNPDMNFEQLSIWTTPLHGCKCSAPWIRTLTKRGAYIHGYCASGQTISCKRRNKKERARRRRKKAQKRHNQDEQVLIQTTAVSATSPSEPT